MRNSFWILSLLLVAIAAGGCATVTRTVDTTPVDLDKDGEAESTRESVSVRYVGGIPPRPSVIIDTTDPAPSEALELAGRAIDSGMSTSVTTSDDGVSLQASVSYPAYVGAPGTYSSSGGVYAASDVVPTYGGGYQVVGGGTLPPLQTTVVQSIPAQVPPNRSSSGEVKCPEKGVPEFGTPEYDACVGTTLKVVSEMAHEH